MDDTSTVKIGEVYYAAFGCYNRFNKGVKDVRFFRFPKNDRRCTRWVVNCRTKKSR